MGGIRKMQTDNSPVKNDISAKGASLWAQIFAGLWIVGWSTFTFITGKDIKVGDIILTAVAIAGMFTPVYFSIIMDKIKDIKLGK
jgi:hypothetical protein